jgi:hypothetical protein
MDSKLVDSISKQIYKRFPEVDGKKPKVRRQTSNSGNKSKSTGTYLLTFQGKAKVQGGKTINRYIRVVADDEGKIIKVSTSR